MAHGHAHTHEHGHALPAPEQVNKAFIIGIALNLIFVLVEATAGFWYDSLALLSDAGHNLSDVISLVLALLAFRMAKVKPNSRYTYGYKKSTVLVSLLNAIILLVAVGIILAESIEKLRNPQPIAGGVIAWVAGVGILINAFTAFLFLKDKERDLNIKGAYLHLMADALVSVGVVISGVIISYTHWYIIDPIIGIAIGIFIGVVGSTSDLSVFALMLRIAGTILFAQGVDNFILQPLLYSNRAKAHPLEIFLVILIAGSMAGVLGMLLAIPAYNVIRVFAKEFFYNFRVVQKLTEKI